MTRTTPARRALTIAATAALVFGGSILTAAPAIADDTALEPIAVGTATISGTSKVGEVLTVDTEGWPADATLSYQWAFNGGQFGGEIVGETGLSYTVGAEYIGLWVGVVVTGHLDGYEDGFVYAGLEGAENVVFTDEAPTASGPVGDSSQLAGFLASSGSTPAAATSAGLPDSLAAGTDYTAEIEWLSRDSFVDVFVYSSPVTIGTFPVVGGVVQIPMSAATLAALAPGAHTLVAVGQSSGGVQSVALSVGLAETGAELGIAPYAIAGSLLLFGAALLMFRRRLAS